MKKKLIQFSNRIDRSLIFTVERGLEVHLAYEDC